MTKKLVLIDAHALIHRAFHALPPLTSPKGEPPGAVYGFTTILFKMIGQLKPDLMVAAFDLAGPTFRHERFEAYKAHRKKAPDELYAQIPNVRRMLQALGVPIYEKEGFEADDIIGTITEQTRNDKDLRVVIVTGDMDTLQLVDRDRVTVFTLRKGVSDTALYDERHVTERFTLTPVQMPDYKGLKGDASDNIPGVPGIGDKTATMLLNQFGTLEKLYAAVEKGDTESITGKLREKLLEHKDQAFFSKELGTITRDVPIIFDPQTADWSGQLDGEAVKALSQELGFYSLAKRLDRVLQEAMPRAPQLILDDTKEERTPTDVVQDIGSAKELPEADSVIVQTTRDGEKLTAIMLATENGTRYTWQTHRTKDLRTVLERYPVIIGHDLKMLLHLAESEEVDTKSWFDTMVAAWILRPTLRDYSLDRVTHDHLGTSLSENEASWMPTLIRLSVHQRQELDSQGLDRLFRDVEMPLIGTLARMEHRGVLVDRKVIAILAKSATKDLVKLQKDIHATAGTEFNISSPQQLGVVLFDPPPGGLGIKGRIKRTATGSLSTAAGELDKIRDAHPIIEKILQWRELSKLVSTYIEPFPELIGEDDRIHTTYNQTGTATGRLSSQDPNLQNIPTRTELGQQFRGSFVAPTGHTLLSLDYTQLELRIVAHIADDATMKDAFAHGEDIHARTASVVFNVPMDRVTPQMRRQAKVLNFGIVYGMGVLGFARAAGIPRDNARQFIDDYFERFAGVFRYMTDIKAQAARDGAVRTLLGRVRPLPEMHSNLPQLVAQAERMAINHPVQGTGADIMKIAMNSLERYLHKTYGDRARLLLQVHDEVVLEVHDDEVTKVAARTKEIMEQAYPLSVPLTVTVKTGKDWSHMEKFTL